MIHFIYIYLQQSKTKRNSLRLFSCSISIIINKDKSLVKKPGTISRKYFFIEKCIFNWMPNQSIYCLYFYEQNNYLTIMASENKWTGFFVFDSTEERTIVRKKRLLSITFICSYLWPTRDWSDIIGTRFLGIVFVQINA